MKSRDPNPEREQHGKNTTVFPEMRGSVFNRRIKCGILRKPLEARVGIGRLKRRLRDKIAHFRWLHKHNTITTRTSTFTTPLLTFLLTVRVVIHGEVSE